MTLLSYHNKKPSCRDTRMADRTADIGLQLWSLTIMRHALRMWSEVRRTGARRRTTVT